MRSAKGMVLLGFAWLALGGSGWAEESADPAGAAPAALSSLSGTVVDSTGAAVAGASVALRTVRVAGERVATSDDTGRFVFDAVPPGPARVTATLERFAPASVEVSGPQTDLRDIGDPFMQGLVDDGIVRPDELGLGLDTTDDGRIIDARGQPNPRLSLVGPLRKGLLWENTAVPELRLEALALAKRLAESST